MVSFIRSPKLFTRNVFQDYSTKTKVDTLGRYRRLGLKGLTLSLVKTVQDAYQLAESERWPRHNGQCNDCICIARVMSHDALLPSRKASRQARASRRAGGRMRTWAGEMPSNIPGHARVCAHFAIINVQPRYFHLTMEQPRFPRVRLSSFKGYSRLNCREFEPLGALRKAAFMGLSARLSLGSGLFRESSPTSM